MKKEKRNIEKFCEIHNAVDKSHIECEKCCGIENVNKENCPSCRRPVGTLLAY